jgi:SPP1 family predicted phage head-tail adaptor
MTLAAGKLRHRVAVERLVTEQDSSGVAQETWSPVGEFWASIEPLSAREFVAASAVQSQVVARIRMRATTGVRASDRIRHGANLYNVQGVLPDLDSGLEYVTIPATAGVNDG